MKTMIIWLVININKMYLKFITIKCVHAPLSDSIKFMGERLMLEKESYVSYRWITQSSCTLSIQKEFLWIIMGRTRRQKKWLHPLPITCSNTNWTKNDTCDNTLLIMTIIIIFIWIIVQKWNILFLVLSKVVIVGVGAGGVFPLWQRGIYLLSCWPAIIRMP